jgi:hypothetical protein
MISIGDLQEDPGLAKRARRFAKRAAEQDSDDEDDADEVID